MEKDEIVSASTRDVQMDDDLVKLSQQFLFAAKTGKNTEGFILQLKTLQESGVTMLKTDNAKKAFWINLYNAFTQTLLKQNPRLYRNRSRFFTAKQLNVAGKKLSFDDLEHGILRRSKNKWGFGYLGKIFPSPVEKAWRVEKLDHRIHFALNCGAKSCPPIAFYSSEKLDQQLASATKSFLENEVDVTENTVAIPAILGWFCSDLGGKKGIRKLLRENGFPSVNAATKIRVSKYNWQLSLENKR